MGDEASYMQHAPAGPGRFVPNDQGIASRSVISATPTESTGVSSMSAGYNADVDTDSDDSTNSSESAFESESTDELSSSSNRLPARRTMPTAARCAPPAMHNVQHDPTVRSPQPHVRRVPEHEPVARYKPATLIPTEGKPVSSTGSSSKSESSSSSSRSDSGEAGSSWSDTTQYSAIRFRPEEVVGSKASELRKLQQKTHDAQTAYEVACVRRDEHRKAVRKDNEEAFDACMDNVDALDHLEAGSDTTSSLDCDVFSFRRLGEATPINGLLRGIQPS